MAGRTIRDKRDARRCLAAVKEAGLTRREWARQHRVDGRSLYAWANRLEREGTSEKRHGMVELVPGGRRVGGRYLIRCGQLAVEVDEHFDEETLARLLKVVTAC